MTPIMARRPFFSSETRFSASTSEESLAVKPSGSHSNGILPGVPPACRRQGSTLEASRGTPLSEGRASARGCVFVGFSSGAVHHVVRLDCRLAEDLEQPHDAEDLRLAVLRRRVPRGVSVAAEGLEGDALLHRDVAREERAARRDPRPAGDSRHRNARVLQLGGAEPGEGLLRGEARVGEAKGVEDLAASLGASALPERTVAAACKDKRQRRSGRDGCSSSSNCSVKDGCRLRIAWSPHAAAAGELVGSGTASQHGLTQ